MSSTGMCLSSNMISKTQSKYKNNLTYYKIAGGLWPHGQYAYLQIRRSGFEPWLGALRCVLE